MTVCFLCNKRQETEEKNDSSIKIATLDENSRIHEVQSRAIASPGGANENAWVFHDIMRCTQKIQDNNKKLTLSFTMFAWRRRCSNEEHIHRATCFERSYVMFLAVVVIMVFVFVVAL